MTRSWPMAGMLILLLASFPTACSELEPVRVDPTTTSHMRDGVSRRTYAPVDVLVVLDNSSSMAGEQAMVLDFLQAMVGDLLDPESEDGSATHAPVRNLHLGLISSDLGTAGAVVPSCREPVSGDDGVLRSVTLECSSMSGRFLSFDEEVLQSGPCPLPEHVDLQRSQWADQMAADFSCVADMGTDGCGYTQPLEAALRALTVHAGPGGPNEGFLRPNSLIYVLFINDGDDCSVDTSDPANAVLFEADFSDETFDLRCHHHPEMLVPVDRYVEAFSELKEDHGFLSIGILSGFPLESPWCQGEPYQNDHCLDDEAMQAVPDPDDPSRPRPSCESAEAGAAASPPRRLYEFAGAMSANMHDVAVWSICSVDFMPVLSPLTSKYYSAWPYTMFLRYRPIEKDPADATGCSCRASCRMMVEMPDDSPCAPPLEPFFERDANGDGRTDAQDAYVLDYFGRRHTTCEIPQVPTRISACPCCVEEGAASCDCDLSCDDEEVRLVQRSCEEGWWYLPFDEPDNAWESSIRPTINYSHSLVPLHARMEILCMENVCPPLRTCGSGRFGGTWCCDPAEYCWNDQCLIRPDICAEYGENLWCPAPDLPHGGLCCLDHDADGVLDLEDLNGDGLGDRASHVCDGRDCVPR